MYLTVANYNYMCSTLVLANLYDQNQMDAKHLCSAIETFNFVNQELLTSVEDHAFIIATTEDEIQPQAVKFLSDFGFNRSKLTYNSKNQTYITLWSMRVEDVLSKLKEKGLRG